MPNYQDGRIYCIRAPGTDEVYIGSTTRPLSERMAKHRSDCKRWKDGKCNNCMSYKLIAMEGVYIELIEEFPCDTKEQLNRREGEIIRTTANCINHYIAGRTRNEWNNENRDIVNEWHRKYRETNNERIKERKRKYREANKEKINERRRVQKKESQ